MSSPERPKVVLIGLDSAGWDVINPLLDQGALPMLAKLAEQGVMGKATSHRPLLAPMVSGSVATGMRADKHGVLGTHEVVNNGAAVRGVNSLSRRACSFWEILSQADQRCHVVHFPFSDPARPGKGVMVAPRFFSNIPRSLSDAMEIAPDAVWPVDLTGTLRELIVAIEEIDAETMGMFVPALAEGRHEDPLLDLLARMLAHTFSIHAVTTGLMEKSGWDVISVNYPVIEQLSRAFYMFRSPKQSWVSDEDCRIYGGVVDAAVRLCDLMINRLCMLAGDAAAVMVYSTMSYPPVTAIPPVPRGMPLPSSEEGYNPEGIFLLKAPGVRADELLHRVTAYDICPTILRLRGVPISAEMDGRPLDDAFAVELPPVEVVERYTIADLDQREKTGMDWREALSFNAPRARHTAWNVQEENEWNLAQSLLTVRDVEKALPLLTRLYYANPLRMEKAPMLAEALMNSGLDQDAMAVVEPFGAANGDSVLGKFASGMVAQFDGDTYRALSLFEEASAENPRLPELYYYMGIIYLRTGKPQRALTAYQKSTEIDPGFQGGHLGMASAYIALGDHEAAADAALQAVAIEFSNPAGHFLLGRALMAMGDIDDARKAFNTTLHFEPGNEVARAALAEIERESGTFESIPCDPDSLPGMSASEVQREARHDAVYEARREVAQWHTGYVDAIEEADGHLDAFLLKNAEIIGAEVSTPDWSDVPGEITDCEWVVRPMLPVDQPIVSKAFRRAFRPPHNAEYLFLHPVGTNDVRGILQLNWYESPQPAVRLALSLAGSAEGKLSVPVQRYLTHKLFRAAICRAAAGGAKRIMFTYDVEGSPEFEQILHELSFQVTLRQTAFQFPVEHMRNASAKILKRFRARRQIPEDIQLVRHTRETLPQAERYLQKYFGDGIGIPYNEVDPDCGRVMLKEGKIVGCHIGAIRGDLLEVPRLVLDPEYRGIWAMPLFFEACAADCDERGLHSLIFCTDEEAYPDFVRIARRHFEAVETGKYITMAMPLAVDWSGN